MQPSRIALIFALSFCAGTLLTLPATVFWVALGLSCLLLAYTARKLLLVTLLLTVIAGLLVGGGIRLRWDTRYHPAVLPISQRFTGTVVAPPSIRSDHILLTVQPDGQQGYILINAQRYPVYAYGDRLRVTGDQELAEAFQDFNYPLYLERSKIRSRIPQPKFIQKLPGFKGSRIIWALYGLRSYLEAGINRYVPEPEASFLEGILLGSSQSIPETIQEALRTTGTSHIIAISGANITILLTILLKIFPVRSLRQRFLLVLGVASGIALMTGASSSVVRGAAMSCISGYLAMHSRRVWSLNLLVYSMATMLYFNPLLLNIDPGFQLSFAAFAGLAAFSPFLQRTLRPGLPEVIRASLIETTAATLGTFIVSCTLFGQASLLGLGVNPLILWLLPPITSLGLILSITAWFPPLSYLVSQPLWILLHLVLAIIQTSAHIPFGLIHWHPPEATALLSCTLFVFILWPRSHVLAQS